MTLMNQNHNLLIMMKKKPDEWFRNNAAESHRTQRKKVRHQRKANRSSARPGEIFS